MQHLPVGHHQAKQAVTFREIRNSTCTNRYPIASPSDNAA